MQRDQEPRLAPDAERLARYPLLKALLARRSRRHARGFTLPNGPLQYRSAQPPRPLTHDEEAALAWAANGVTGPVLADLPYGPGDRPGGGAGGIMTHLVGRTAPSGDAIHTVALFVINDAGTWFLRRPQDYPREEIAVLVERARAGEFGLLYKRARIKIADSRLDVARETPFVPPFNQWSANLPGTSYFLPVADLSALAINVMLSAFDAGFDYFILDERNRFAPAGLARFARSRGGHLNDDPRSGKVATLAHLDSWLYEFAAVEQGAILQNLGLMAAALNLGGFTHFAAHPYAWPQALGFRVEYPSLSRTIGANPLVRAVMRASGRDLPVPTPVGLERDGTVLLRPYSPPYYPSMREAVRAFVDYKFGPGHGTLRDGGAHTAWRDSGTIQGAITSPSDRAIAATIACASYIYERYGRFPAGNGPFRTVLAFQAHHLDERFYEQFYRRTA